MKIYLDKNTSVDTINFTGLDWMILTLLVVGFFCLSFGWTGALTW